VLRSARCSTGDGLTSTVSEARPEHLVPRANLRRRLWPVVSWAAVLAFLIWALRVVAIEGYLNPSAANFVGDFKSAITGEGLPPGEWWAGHGIFYGPIFVLEWKSFLYAGYVSIAQMWFVDVALLAISFICTWVAVFGRVRPRLLTLTAALWLANIITVELIAAVQHLEVLELAALSVALLLVQRGREVPGGLSLGLAVATKTLPVVYLPYLVILRKWRALVAATVMAAALLLITCAVQGVTPWDGAIMLLNQGQNLSKTKATEYELGLRAFFIRALTGGAGDPTPLQTQVAFGLHTVVSALAVLWTAFVLARSRQCARSITLSWGVIATTMLVVAPVTHIFYYVFMLPGWTAALGDLVERRLTWTTGVQWVALTASYVFMGFDLPFLLMYRFLGIGQFILGNWLSFIPLSLLLSIAVLSSLLLLNYRNERLASSPSRYAPTFS
jgi:Glycosyltransferase family 87